MSVVGVLAAGSLEAFETCVNARCNALGNSLPRLAARRRMPRQAVALKKYRCGSSPVSKTSDNEHTSASLGNSEVLSVKNPVCVPIPEFAQSGEEGSEITRFVSFPFLSFDQITRRLIAGPDGKDTGDVLPNHPLGPILCSNRKVGKHEVATRVSQSCSETCDAEGLARGSSAEKIESCIWPVLELRHVAQVGHVGVVVCEHSAREGLNLTKTPSFPAEGLPGDGSRLDARADG